VLEEKMWTPEVRVEIDDDCPDDDLYTILINEGIEETSVTSLYSVDVLGQTEKGFEIRYNLPRPGWVRIDVFDASGRWVSQVCSDPHEEGRHSSYWDGCDNRGRKAASGTYLVRTQANDYKDIQRVFLLR
jgi:hypothetical protein